MNKQLKILFIGTYVPKECGIATFTHDLLNSVRSENVKCEVIAVNDPYETYNYPEEVVFQIDRDKLKDYYLAADYINQSDAISYVFNMNSVSLGGTQAITFLLFCQE